MPVKNPLKLVRPKEPIDFEAHKEYTRRWRDWYRSIGLNIIGLPPQSKGEEGTVNWKPYQTRKATDLEIQAMFEPLANIALIHGRTSENAVTLDFDADKGGKKSFEKLKGEFPDTFIAKTGGGGYHVHFTTDILPKSANIKLKQYGIEIMSEGSLVVMPPSIHESGHYYEPYQGSKYPEHNKDFAHIEGDFENWVYRLIKDKIDNNFKPKQIVPIDEILEGVEDGERNWSAIRLATWYRRAGLSEEDCYNKMMEWNQKNDPPCQGNDFTALERTIQQAYIPTEPYNFWFSRQPEKITVFSPEVQAKADEILAEGKALQYIVETAQQYHIGDKEVISIEWISGINSHSPDKIKINLWAIGKSQKGKSHSFYTTLLFIPEECYEVFTSASPLSLFYYVYRYGEESLDKKIVFIDEFESSKFAEPMLRSLTGQTDITPRHLSVHDAQLLDLIIRGKRSTWFTSVKTFGTDQIKNRFVHINPDETAQQDRDVWTLQDKTIREEDVQIPEEPLQIGQCLFAKIIEKTKELTVRIPYEIGWPYKSRRWLYPIFLMFIRTLARINYKQREITDENQLVASKEDFYQARNLWKAFIKSIIYRVSYSSMQILEILSEDPDEAKTHEEISREIPLSIERIRTLCQEMVSEELLNFRKRGQQDKPGRGSYEYWKAIIPSIDAIRLKEEIIHDESNNKPINQITKSISTSKLKNKIKNESPNSFGNLDNYPLDNYAMETGERALYRLKEEDEKEEER